MEALVECHVAEGGSGAEDEAERMGTEGKEEEEEGTSTEEEDNTKGKLCKNLLWTTAAIGF